MRFQGREKSLRHERWKEMVMKTDGMSSGMYGNFLMPETMAKEGEISRESGDRQALDSTDKLKLPLIGGGPHAP